MANFDRNLLFLLSENARYKLKSAAQVLRKSPQRLNYSVEVLQKEGVIHNPHCIFDYSYLGLILFRVYFRGAYITEKDKQDVLKFLSSNDYIVTIYELSGEFDLVIEMACPNPSRFNKELKKMGTVMPSLNNYKVGLNVVTHIYPRVYLPTEKSLTAATYDEIVVGGDRASQSFDQEEIKLIRELAANPLVRLTTLAKNSRLNIKTATKVFKNLQDRKFIRGFQYLIDINKLDIYKVRLFLKLHNQTQERDAGLLAFMIKNPEIVQLHRTIGDWDMEIDIESYEKTRIREIIMSIREQFKDLIETFNTIEFYDRYKKSFIPPYYFKQEELKMVPSGVLRSDSQPDLAPQLTN